MSYKVYFFSLTFVGESSEPSHHGLRAGFSAAEPARDDRVLGRRSLLSSSLPSLAQQDVTDLLCVLRLLASRPEASHKRF